jgi:hypothetical protein
MSAPLILTPKQWANPEEIDKLMADLIQLSAEKGLVSLTLVGELASGEIYYQSSRTEDRFKIAGALMGQAMRLLGFRDLPG